MATTLGWSWDEIAALPLTRLWAFYSHWKKQPPAHVLLAAFLDWKGAESVPRGTSESEQQGAAALIFAVGGPSPNFAPQATLPDGVQRSLEEMHATPAYQRYRQKLRKRAADRGTV